MLLPFLCKKQTHGHAPEPFMQQQPTAFAGSITPW